MDFTPNENESYKDFIYRSLKGQIDEKELKLIVVLAEIIVTELRKSPYTMSISTKPEEITICFAHKGKAIKENIINIIDNQVDYLHYYHESKDDHILRIRIRKKFKCQF